MQKTKVKEKLNNKGQSLVEYLILVVIVAIGTIGVVRTLGFNISANFTQISNALTNNSAKVETKDASKFHKMRDFGNFMDGATDSKNNK